MTDEAIVALYFARNEKAIEESKIKYSQYLLSIAQRILCQIEDAKECENSTYFQAWRSIPPSRPTYLGAYLGKIIRNFALQALRKVTAARRGGKTTPLPIDELSFCLADGISADDALNTKLLADCLNRFLLTLSKTDRHIFVLRYWYCKEIAEIGEIFSYKESRVKMKLLRARQKLLAHLQKEGFTQ